MKVLLYEPAEGGHHLVILRYTIKSLDAGGIQWVEVREDCYSRPGRLVELARQHSCDVIFILTVDGRYFFAWILSWLARPFGIRTVCTYYLFNNLVEGKKAIAWHFLLATGFIQKLQISESRLLGAEHGFPKQASYLPDPWDPAEFPEWTQEAARQHLGIPLGSTVFTMFGGLDERKGADLFLKASYEYAANHKDRPVVFLLAGKMSPGVEELFENSRQYINESVVWISLNKHIPESDVSAVFYATDFLACPYPAWFKVSSNSVTRALAAGRPIIAPSHGVNGRLVKDKGCGFTYSTGSLSSLTDTFTDAINLKLNDPKNYAQICAIAKEIAKDRCLEVYGHYLRKNLGAE